MADDFDFTNVPSGSADWGVGDDAVDITFRNLNPDAQCLRLLEQDDGTQPSGDRMHIGVTGTQHRHLVKPIQKLRTLLRSIRNTSARQRALKPVLHHGDCIGADQIAHDLARKMDGWIVHSHPPDAAIKRAFCDADVTYDPLPYLTRNRMILERINEELIALPATMERQRRSGTWYTMHQAELRKIKTIILWPDGRTTVTDDILVDAAAFAHIKPRCEITWTMRDEVIHSINGFLSKGIFDGKFWVGGHYEREQRLAVLTKDGAPWTDQQTFEFRAWLKQALGVNPSCLTFKKVTEEPVPPLAR